MLRARHILKFLGISAILGLAGCASWIRGDIGDGDLKGRLLIEWYRQDGFVYRKAKDPLKFRPDLSWWPKDKFIIPKDMYTTGGSVPQIFWGIPGLSPWALGPAYIIHDWIFEVHRCPNRWADDPEVAKINYQEAALILAQIGKALIKAELIDDNMLEPVVWAVTTRYVEQAIWDQPGTAQDCRVPDPRALRARSGRPVEVVNFTIPQPRR